MAAGDTPRGAMTIPRLELSIFDHKGQNEGADPVPGNPHTFRKIAGILLPLISL